MEEKDLVRLVQKIELAREQLHQAVREAGSDLHAAAVRRASARLDTLITAYLQRRRKGGGA